MPSNRSTSRRRPIGRHLSPDFGKASRRSRPRTRDDVSRHGNSTPVTRYAEDHDAKQQGSRISPERIESYEKRRYKSVVTPPLQGQVSFMSSKDKIDCNRRECRLYTVRGTRQRRDRVQTTRDASVVRSRSPVQTQIDRESSPVTP